MFEDIRFAWVLKKHMNTIIFLKISVIHIEKISGGAITSDVDMRHGDNLKHRCFPGDGS